MANRTGTYFAFDGLGETNPARSDFKYYATVQSWDAAKGIDFRFVNSHDKAGAVRDTSKKATLVSSILQRLNASKNMIVLISSDTRKSGSMLSFEIEKAVDSYKIPLIIAYAGYDWITEPNVLSALWPTALATRLNNGTAKAIHVPFRKDAILDAIGQFSINGTQLQSSMIHYTRETQVNWGYIK